MVVLTVCAYVQSISHARIRVNEIRSDCDMSQPDPRIAIGYGGVHYVDFRLMTIADFKNPHLTDILIDEHTWFCGLEVLELAFLVVYVHCLRILSLSSYHDRYGYVHVHM
jgi:hypothetical protein